LMGKIPMAIIISDSADFKIQKSWWWWSWDTRLAHNPNTGIFVLCLRFFFVWF
jgi:hypothetical protein